MGEGKMRNLNKLKTILIVAILTMAAFPLVLPHVGAASGSDPNVFSIMQISDTQHLAFLSPALYNDTISWIVNNSASNNLQMVVHTGDFVDALTTTSTGYILYNSSQLAQEWTVANAAMSKLSDANIPYVWCAGNHDQTPWGNSNGTMRGSSYPAFNTTVMRSKPYWVSDIYDAKNTAAKFSTGGYTFMVIDIEYLANSSVLTWMKGLLDKNPSANVIVATHGYLNALAGYGSSNPVTAATEAPWTQALKSMMNSYPNVFLALSGHINGVNMTRVGGRQEALFCRQDFTNSTGAATGAASVRIYTFNLTSKKVSATTYCLDTKTWLTDAYNQFSFDASITSDWTLVTNARPMKAYSDLLEYVWQKDARMPPNTQYDKIALHRLVKTGVVTRGVVFLTNCPTWGTGAERISNPSSDSWTKYENFSNAIYWANRGFDVYAIDYRSHFVPRNLTTSQMSFMANWGWDVWVNDIKEAAEQVKAVSGTSKFFISGECTGGEAALNYATKYPNDLRGIILLDMNFIAVTPAYPVVGTPKTTNTFNLPAALASLDRAQNWTRDDWPQWFKDWANYALQNPGAPAISVNGTAANPATNPATNKTWANITEYISYAITYSFGAPTAPGFYSNILGGYGNVTQDLYSFINSEYIPLRLLFENLAMADWTNCPYMTYDYNDHYKDISVPVIAFESSLFGSRTGPFQFVNGIATSDFTGVLLKNYGHMDVFMGVNSAKDISQPAADWMANHYQPPAASAFASATIFAGQSWYFVANSNGGSGSHTYQWYEGTSPIAGQTDLLLKATKATAGTYTFYCKVTDAEGLTANSNTVTLTVK